MKYLFTKQEHYRLFVESNKTDRISKGLKIYTTSKDDLFSSFKLNEEIFNQPLPTKYIFKTDEDNKKEILFKSNSDNEYRLDIFFINEVDKGFVSHTSFSLADKSIEDTEEYEKLTNKNEMIEILNRVHYILKDLVKNYKIPDYIYIGGTEIEKKNIIYQYFLKVIVGERGFKKLNTTNYKTKYGLYFYL